ncbi:RDD family protein [Peribacillus saganii]|uniref:RDD family protein n=2 Tax=Peribacillus saganii TaxID=2303992 RepID=A0A372LJL3_9BACI|nr:RDD family protein [Peribacillus saganii]
MDLSQSPLLQSAPEEEQTGKKIRSIQETADNRLFFAGFWMRFWAYILDLIIVGSIDRLVFKPILKAVGITHYDIAIFSPVTIASAVVFYLYFVLMTKYLGQTLGKMVFGLRVVGLKENRLSWGTVLFRELIGRFISKTTFIGYIIVGFLPKKQGLHDIFADTTVVLEKR